MVSKMHIMVVDDERIVRESFRQWFKKLGHVVETAASGAEALRKLNRTPFDLLFVDVKMPGMSGIELLEKVKQTHPDTCVVIITAYGSVESAVHAMQIGAADYLLKPFKPDHLSLVIEKIFQKRELAAKVRYLKGRLAAFTRFDNIIGKSAAMQKIFDLIAEVSESDSAVLLTGETGTGKELIAKALHAKSRRAAMPFIAVNAGALPETLLESELFGHVRGAFTGALHGRKGFFEVVSGGTLFLDEIGEISPRMQVDLLRVLEEKEIKRVGSSQPLAVDFRLVCATSRKLEKQVQQGHFREDLFYRINVIRIQVPPLRERREDIPLLVNHFIEKFSHETTKHVEGITVPATDRLQAYNWPGNVRELENAVERAIVLSHTRLLDVDDFSFLTPAAPPRGERSLWQMEKNHIIRTLVETHGNISRAAKILEINRATLHKKINRYGLKRSDYITV